ncbi:MAG: thiaminase II [Rhodobacteraceae bacterium]|nr:thiaminase II [Paracoccaceae bacterium]
MSLFERLREDNKAVWQRYTQHNFVMSMARGDLPEESFKTYLQQDYLFLIQFSRAYALAVYKASNLADMREALEGLKALLDVEMELHVELCAQWGITKTDLEALPEASETIGYTRYVLETGMSGDLLDLQVALAPCILGYAEIGRANLASMPEGPMAAAYRRWFEEYGGDAYQEAAGAFENWMNNTAADVMTPVRYGRLSTIFAQATQLEGDFWQMGLKQVV